MRRKPQLQNFKPSRAKHDHEMNFELHNNLIIALDVDSAEEALLLAQSLKGRAGAFKVGPRLCMRYGADLVKKLATYAPVFVDNKYLDIPSTVDAAIKATFEAGATLATVHAWNGKETLARLAETERALNQKRAFKILAVTILTSFTQETLPPGSSKDISQSVEELAKLTLDCGLTGIVCSPHEVAKLRAQHKSSYLVTPGVRLPDDDIGDQKRTETPAEAIRRGSSALVIGRPIIGAKDPIAAADRVIASINEGQKKGLLT
jgi:orotidine-5'-phosphate decarboxylase